MDESCVLSVTVTPRARRDEIAGWQGESIRVRVKAPPVDGKANEALCRFLAASLGVPARQVTLVSGETARLKRLRIEGMTLPAAKEKLAGLIARR